ncbi:CPBP family intramembrane metalloprotease [Tamlana agarivorans]|uniref:CPBP family intramembrane metalloprotease n=1 Tax=Pseudotamlana agarivorans TaxID=481183 RepID=A0ACC5UCT2_9FLAO|nr:type II CAAX endopeptidase family protein [Tamlana agarivorans]MBU2952074.1 CPBP family intramembrane metalloprotease [Tamlana agarivorans]
MKRIPLSHLLIVTVLWAFFTFVYAKVFVSSEKMSLAELVHSGLAMHLLFAAATVLIYSYIRPANIIVGLNKIKAKKNWILIYPVFVITLCLITSGLNGIFSDFDSYKWVLFNCIFVGISEELMFRGILLSSLTKKFGFWKAAIVVIVTFGLIHIMNVFTTGELGQGIAQAFFAMSSGVLFLAIRIKTLSIVPAIILHALWDFTAFTMEGLVSADGNVEGALAMAGVVVSLLVSFSPIIFGILGIIQLTKKKAIEEFVQTQEAAI